MTYNKGGRSLGFKKEAQAASFLVKNNIYILKKNFRCRFGEIDIIFKDKNYIVFGEVKFRSRVSSGTPEDYVDYKKQVKICRTADFFRACYGIHEDIPIRYDVIAMGEGFIHWHKNAFDHIFMKKKCY